LRGIKSFIDENGEITKSGKGILNSDQIKGSYRES
jgi:hypothetical protein